MGMVEVCAGITDLRADFVVKEVARGDRPLTSYRSTIGKWGREGGKTMPMLVSLVSV